MGSPTNNNNSALRSPLKSNKTPQKTAIIEEMSATARRFRNRTMGLVWKRSMMRPAGRGLDDPPIKRCSPQDSNSCSIFVINIGSFCKKKMKRFLVLVVAVALCAEFCNSVSAFFSFGNSFLGAQKLH